MRYKVQIRVKFLKFLVRKIMYYQSKTKAPLSNKLYTILISICKFSLPRKGAIIPGKCFLLHLHVKLLSSFEYVQSDSTAKLNLICFSNY